MELLLISVLSFVIGIVAGYLLCYRDAMNAVEEAVDDMFDEYHITPKE